MANEQRYQRLEPISGAKLIADSTATGDKIIYDIPYRCTFRQLQLHVGKTEATALIIAMDKRVLLGSDSGRVELDTITLPASNQQGKVYFLNGPDLAARFEFVPGDQIVIEVTTASTGDKGASIELLVDRDAEVEANESDMTQVA